MNLRLLKFILIIPLFIACQAGSEIIRPDTDDEGDAGFSCTLSTDKVEFARAYGYEPYALEVMVGEEAAVVDLGGAPWLEVEGNVDLLYPDSHMALNLVPKEPNYSPEARSGVVVLKGKYTGESVEVAVNQAGSYQDAVQSKSNSWQLTSDLVSSEEWLKDGVMTANQEDMNALLSLEHSVNSPVEIIQDEGRGTFRGMQVGDAVLLRLPVQNVDKETAVSAMLNLSQKTSGVQCEWVAEYWDGGAWNAKTTFTTSKETEDYTYTSCTCDFTLAEPVVNDYIKVRFRKASGSTDVTNFIAADPAAGAYIRLTEPKKPLVLTIDFASWPLSGTPPKSAKVTTEEDVYVLTHEGVDYEFRIHAPATGWYYTGKALRFQATGGGYLKLPAVEGKALVKITVAITNTSGKAVYVSSDGSDKGDILGSTNIPASGSKTCELTGTLPGTSYYLYTNAKNTQIGKVILTYE